MGYSADQRAIMLQLYLDGATVPAIMNICGCSKTTVTNLVKKFKRGQKFRKRGPDPRRRKPLWELSRRRLCERRREARANEDKATVARIDGILEGAS